MADGQLTYSADQIIRYLEGNLSITDQYQLEKAALEDPFLQDALDGYALILQQQGKEALFQALEQSRNVFGKRTSTSNASPVKPFIRRRWVQYGVAASVLLGLGWYLFSLTNPVISPATDKPLLDEVPQVIQNPSDTIQGISDIVLEQPQIGPEEKPKTTDLPVTPPSIKELTKEPDVSSAAAQEVGKPPTNAVRAPSASADLQRELVTADAPNKSAARLSMDSGTVLISGQTLDSENFPVEYVLIKDANGRLLAESDELGRFVIHIKDSIIDVTATANGFTTNNYQLKANNQKNIIVLKPKGSGLQEDVVSQMVKAPLEERKTISVKVTSTTTMMVATPVAGLRSFERYMASYLPAMNTEKISLSGTFTISFGLSKEGAPVGIKVLESSNQPLDGLLEKALLDGPSWRQTSPVQEALVRIKILIQ